MSVLFIDTGYTNLGFCIFNKAGELIQQRELTLKCGKMARVKAVCEFLCDLHNQLSDEEIVLEGVVFEKYTIRPGDPKSIRGQGTLFINGVIASWCETGGLRWMEWDHNAWRSIWKRYYLDRGINKKPVLSIKTSSDHVVDAFKMGVAWYVKKGVVK